jgi:hypothetical protein
MIVRVALALLSLVFAMPTYAAFAHGNVLAGVGQGKIKEFTPAGVLVATYDTTTNSNETTGMCMDAAGNLYATMWTIGTVSKFGPNGVLINANFITGLSNPESCQIDKTGDLFVGQTGGGIGRFNASTGALITTYSDNPARSGWIDIAADQCTIFYADDSAAVSRYDICTTTQLPDFATVGTVSGLRVLGNGDVLASNRTKVTRLNSAGTVLGDYNAPAGNNLIFAVTLDPDGQTFWTADLVAGNIFRYNLNPINSTPITTFNSGQFVDTAGILVIGEITVGGPGPGPTPPPVSALPVPTLSEWALMLLVAALGALAFSQLRRRKGG